MKNILRCNDSGIDAFVRIVRGGGVVVFPTDTVYGIGCNPYDNNAVRRIYAIKKRDYSKPLPILVKDITVAERLIEVGKLSKYLASRCWPGGLTIVGPLRDRTISRYVTAGSSELAVRVPGSQCLKLALDQLEAIVGTSANLSGGASSNTIEEVCSAKLEGVDGILDGGPAVLGTESTIVRENCKPKGTGGKTSLTIIREGAIGRLQIMSLVQEFERNEKF